MADRNPTKETKSTEWTKLLADAVSTPGAIMKAYSNFWNYSVGNQLLALFQIYGRNIPAGPIASFNRWKELGRYVRKGEKAIELCMPVTCKKTEKTADGTETTATFTRFVYKRNWFTLAQTDGAEYVAPAAPGWDRSAALAKLEISEVRFEMLNGNTQGYAKGREIAINPVAQHPVKTTFHELAHVVLGHTSEGAINDEENVPRSLREVEAEAVALICLEALGLDGAEFCRGYIQGWNNGAASIPERSAQKIFKAADAILKAGRPSSIESEVAA
jgi:antirestriction protein ArdC